MSPRLELLLPLTASFIIFTGGVLVGADFADMVCKPPTPHVKADGDTTPLPANTFRVPFTLGDGTRCVPHGEWLVCVPPPSDQYRGDACYNGNGKEVPCKKEEFQ